MNLYPVIKLRKGKDEAVKRYHPWIFSGAIESAAPDLQAGDIVTEYDKLIDRQLERASISCIAGFAKVFTDACKVLKY